MKKMIAAGVIVAIWILICVLVQAAELPPIPPMPEKFKNIQNGQTRPIDTQRNCRFFRGMGMNYEWAGAYAKSKNYHLQSVSRKDKASTWMWG